jgi:hypothetical protein
VADPLGLAAFQQERYMGYVSTASAAIAADAVQLAGICSALGAESSAAAAPGPPASD